MDRAEGSGASRAAEFASEDAFLVDDELGLYVVCDADRRGSDAAIAGDLAVAALGGFVADAERAYGAVLTEQPLSRPFADRAVRCAIEAVTSRSDVAWYSPNLSMLLLLGGRGVVGHTGDSRVYRIRRGRLSQLTIDHDETEAIRSAPVGSARPGDPVVDTFAVELWPDDVFVLCTDGAIGAVEDPVIVRLALDASPSLLASRIVSLAHRTDREVDATAVVVRVRDLQERSSLLLSARPARAEFGYSLTADGAAPAVERNEDGDLIDEEAASHHGSVPRRHHALGPDAAGPGEAGSDPARRKRTR